jgi:hypothetical protein
MISRPGLLSAILIGSIVTGRPAVPRVHRQELTATGVLRLEAWVHDVE